MLSNFDQSTSLRMRYLHLVLLHLSLFLPDPLLIVPLEILHRPFILSPSRLQLIDLNLELADSCLSGLQSGS